MYNILKDSVLSKEDFQPFPFYNNHDLSVSTPEENTEKDSSCNSYDAGLAVVPFARSSRTVRRDSERLHQQECSYEKCPTKTLFSSSTSPIPKRLPWETIGHASRELQKDGIRVEHLDTKPFPFGVFGNRVVARHRSPRVDQVSRCAHISKEDLPHPSKIMRKRKHSKARQKRCGMDVEAHVAQLRRKHAEFNWLPKAVSTDDSYLADPEEEITQSERTLQKVPNSSSPLSTNQLWSGVTPRFYSDSPYKIWSLEEYDRIMSTSNEGLSIQDQTIPSACGLFEPEREDDNDEDFHLISFYSVNCTKAECMHVQGPRLCYIS